jgi:outer membrane protein assembly factor BamB
VAATAPEAVAHRPTPVWTWPVPVGAGPHQLRQVKGGVFADIDGTVAVLTRGGRPRWSHPMDEPTDWQGIVPGTDVMVGAGVDDSSAHGTTALNLRTGNIRWQSVDPFEALTGQGVLTREGRQLVMRSARSGRERWRIDSPRRVAAAGSAVYVADGDVVRRLSGTTGEETWTSRTGRVEDLEATSSMVVLTRSDSVVALNPRSGSRVWSRRARHGATVGFLANRLVWVHYKPKSERDFPATTARILDAAGHSRGLLRLRNHEGFDPVTFRASGATYLLNGAEGRLYDDRLKQVGTHRGDSLVPASTGIYAVTDDEISFSPFAASAPRWRLRLPQGGGLSTLVVARAFYAVGPGGVTRYQ